MGVDLARCGCAMDMVDGALEMVDVKLFSRRMGGVVVACFVANGSGFVSRLRAKFPIFSDFFAVWKLDIQSSLLLSHVPQRVTKPGESCTYKNLFTVIIFLEKCSILI